MAGVTIHTGPIDATAYLQHVPQDQWRELVRARRDFLQVKLSYDCRALLRYVDEANAMIEPLGYADLDDFIRRGLGLEPQLVQWAIEGLRTITPDEPIKFDHAVTVGQTLTRARTQQAAAMTTGEVRERKDNQHAQIAQASQVEKAVEHGVSRRTQQKLDRLARDFPALHAKVVTGELTTHAAAKQAGIVKELTPLQRVARLWVRLSDDDRHAFLSWVKSHGAMEVV